MRACSHGGARRSTPRNAERPRAADPAPASSRFRGADQRVAPPRKRVRRPKGPPKRLVPFGGSRTACRCPGKVTSSRAPSRGGSMLPGVLYADGLRGRSGFPTPAIGSLVRFRRAPRYLHPPSTASVSRRFHPPSSLSPPSESCGLRPASRPDHPAAGGSRSASLGVPFPHRGTSRWRPPIAQGTRPCATFRPRRFSRPRRFPPPPALRVCFAPQPRPGFALQGIVPRAEPYRVSPARSCPHVVGRQSLRFDPRQLGRPRLQGLAPRGECGDERNLFRVPSAPRPSWALPPPGLHSTHRGNDFAFPPPTAFLRGEPAATGPRCIDSAGHGLPGTRLPTRSRFLT